MKRETDLQIKQDATRLRLTFIRDNLEVLIKTATEAKMTQRETLAYFFSQEIEQRNANRARLWIQAAHFPVVKELETYDVSFQPSIDPGVFRELSTMEWITTGENLVLIGPPGVGKTHIAIGLGLKAVRAGLTTRFYSARDLVDLLLKAEKEQCLDRTLKEINKVKLLIIDEFGYLPYAPGVAHLLFQLISQRYEKRSVIVTSNRAPGEWGLILGDKVAASAILDRLLHHCTPMSIQGESYRMHQHVMQKTKTELKEDAKMEI